MTHQQTPTLLRACPGERPVSPTTATRRRRCPSRSRSRPSTAAARGERDDHGQCGGQGAGGKEGPGSCCREGDPGGYARESSPGQESGCDDERCPKEPSAGSQRGACGQRGRERTQRSGGGRCRSTSKPACGDRRQPGSEPAKCRGTLSHGRVRRLFHCREGWFSGMFRPLLVSRRAANRRPAGRSEYLASTASGVPGACTETRTRTCASD